MQMLNSAAPLTREDLSNLERQLGITLPEDYAAFLLENNGGTPEEDWFFDFFDGVMERDSYSIIRGFYKVNLGNGGVRPYEDFAVICNVMWREQTLGRDMVAIADDPGGNPICMYIAGENCGKVCYANHEFEDADTGYLFTSEIAQSFSAFMEKLYLKD